MSKELVIALISLVGGGVITFLITKYFRERKSLAYQIVSKMSLIDVKPEVRDKIRIDYDGKPAENIFSFKVRVINDGNVPIKNQPILFEFDKQAKVLVADYNTKPQREFGEIKKIDAGVQNEVKFVVGLLNPKSKKEIIEFNFLTVDNKDYEMRLHAKGENLKIHEVPSTIDKLIVLPVTVFEFFVGFFLVFVTIAALVIGLLFPKIGGRSSVISGFILSAVAFLLIVMYLRKKYGRLNIARSFQQPGDLHPSQE
jgi:hypothetical protein